MPTAYTAESLDEMSYRDLQALAKDNKIRANQKADEMRKALKKTLSTKSSTKSSSSSTRKNKQTLLEKFPSEIVDKILLEKKIAEILPKILKENKPHGTGELWFDYDNANVFKIYSKKKPLTKTITEFKTEHIIPLVELTLEVEDLIATSILATDYSKMKKMMTNIQLGINTLFQKFNIYFNTEYIDDINNWIEEYNNAHEKEHKKKKKTFEFEKIEKINKKVNPV